MTMKPPEPMFDFDDELLDEWAAGSVVVDLYTESSRTVECFTGVVLSNRALRMIEFERDNGYRYVIPWHRVVAIVQKDPS